MRVRLGLKPHQQVAVILVAFVAAASFVATSTGSGLKNIDAEVLRANALYPTGQAFEAWRTSADALTKDYIAFLSAPTPEARSATLATAPEQYAKGLQLWNAYKRDRLGTPEEQRRFKKVDDLYTQMTDLGTKVFLIDVPTPQELQDMQSTFTAIEHASGSLAAYYAHGVQTSMRSALTSSSGTQHDLVIWGEGTLIAMAIVGAIVFRDLRKRDRQSEARSYRAQIETQLQRALEMAHTEDRAYGVLEEALDLIVPGLPAEFLVADSSRAHFHQVVSLGTTAGSGCPVSAPSECPVAGSGQTRVFGNSTDLDACPYLRDRPSGPCAGACSAVCVPVSITGKTVGVIHTIGANGHVFDRETVANLELVARKSGERIGMLRAFSRSQTQAQTDPLTGLLNRRSLEDQARGLVDGGDRYVVAYGDLDHFKMLNDVHGHDAGDRALRLFARILRDNVRPNDLPARYGGEEFVIVLPACSIDQAKVVIERIRDRLASSFEGGAVATFTVSFGLAVSDPTLTFGEVIDVADGALLAAKASGRNRVVVANDPNAFGDDPLPNLPPRVGGGSPLLENIPAEVLADPSGP